MAAIAARPPAGAHVAPGAPSVRDRILDAAIDCVAVQGVRATTVDDVAQAAGCGRATVYRTFPGGRDELIQQAGLRQIERFATSSHAALAATDDLESLLVVGVSAATAFFLEEGALRHLVEHEPEVLAVQVGFDRMDAVFATVADFAVPHLVRFLEPERAAEVAEWMTRLVLSHLFVPPEGTDLRDPEHARWLVRTFVLPGLRPSTPEPSTDEPPTTAGAPA